MVGTRKYLVSGNASSVICSWVLPIDVCGVLSLIPRAGEGHTDSVKTVRLQRIQRTGNKGSSIGSAPHQLAEDG
jgi:hypothetical protein